MDHDAVAIALSEFLSGDLDAETAAEVRSHLKACAQCRQVAGSMEQIAQVAAATGPALLDPHPSADSLADYALSADSMPLNLLSKVGAHVRVCPTCRRETRLARQATAHRDAWWQRFVTWLLLPSRSPQWASVAAAVAVLALLVYPSYLGLVSFPRLRSNSDQLRSQLDQGGGVKLLYLTGEVRGAAEEIPEVHLATHQSFQLLAAEYNIENGRSPAPSESLAVRITCLPEGVEVWRLASTVQEVWDPTLGIASVLVPARVLEPGEYRLEIVPADSTHAEFASRFRIASPSG